MEERLNNKPNKRDRNTSSIATALAARPSIEKIIYSDAAKTDALFDRKIELIMEGIELFVKHTG
jgi:hypothetical protein